MMTDYSSRRTEEYRKNQRDKKIGKLNPMYKHGESHCGKVYIPISKALEQKCFICNTINKLVVHHLDFDCTNNSLSNISIVCRACHNRIHKTKKVVS